MKNLSQFINSANAPQITGGGASHSSTVVTPVWKGSRPTVSRRSTDSQPKEHRTHTLLCKALKYAAMILMVMTLGVGNVWGDNASFSLPTNLGSAPLKGYVYSVATATTGVITSNKIFYAGADVKLESKAMSAQMAIVFKPSVNCTMNYGYTIKSSARTLYAQVYEINDTLYNLYVAAENGYLGSQALLSSRGHEKDSLLWTACNMVKVSSKKFQLSGDSAKAPTAYTVKPRLHTILCTDTASLSASTTSTRNVMFNQTETKAEFESGKAYLVYWKASSTTGQQITSVTFTPASVTPTHTVTAATNNESYGTAAAASGTVAEGGTTTITATPKTGYRFVSWAVSGTGSTLSSTSTNPTTLTMGTANTTVTATFEATPTHTISYTSTKDMDNTANPTSYTEGVGVASFAKLRHAEGYDFTGWSPSSISSSATTDQTIEAQWSANAAAAGTGTLTHALAFSSGTITTSSITRVNGALYDATDVSLAHTTFSDNANKTGCSGKLTTTTAKDNEKYVEVTFKIADGYTFTPTEVRVQGIAVSTTKTIEVELTDNADTPNSKSVSGTLTAVNSPTTGGYTVTLDFDESDPVVLEGTVTAKIFAYGAADHWRMGTPFVITGTVASTTPASGYAITKSATNGTIAVTDGTDAITSADAGDEVSIAATPATGYEFTSWSVYKTGDAETTVTLADDDDTDNKTRKFTMPAYPITVGATFTAIDYTVTHSAATNGSYTIKVGDAEPVSTNTTANYGQTVTLAASPNSGYSFAGWTVMQGETPVSVSSNQFTMPAGNVTISASFAQEPNVYYYKNESRYDGETYKNPEGNDAGSDDNTALTTPWTICNACVTGVTKVEATAARYDGKGNHMNAYIKLRQSDGGKIVFTIASGYKATIKIKMGGYSGANTSLTMKLNDSGDNISYSGTMSGAGTTENDYAELTYANLAAGAYTLKPTSGSLYISQIDIQTTAVYTLTYDANGGTGTMDNTVGTGTVTLRTNTYTKSGCTFQGWATSQDNANAGTVAYADGATDYNLSANATLYAVWKLNAPTISCSANVVTMSAMSGAAIYYTTDGETTPTSSSTLYNSSSKPQIAANTTFKAIAVLENYVSSDVTTQTCEYVAPATVDDLVTIDADYTFTPSAAMTANTLYESDKIIAIGDGNSYSSGLQIKENRAIAFKVADNAKVKVTFNEKSDDSTPRKMQLGTATSGDAKTAYGMSGSSPVVFDVITTGGVVYLTASKDLYMTKLEILYPHTVTYALGDGTGTLPTEGSHYKGDQFDVHDGTTGITAPDGKEFSVWSDGTSTYAGGAQYTMGSANVTLTAQWITALPLPTITFNDGAYTIAGDALNLSSLFSSNSDGAVTYTVKTAGATGATIDGTSFTATTAGSAVVTASQAATASYKAKSVDATITVSAPTEPEGVKLVEDNTLTGNFRSSRTLSDGSCTVAGISYSKYVTMGSTYTSWGPDAGPSGKYFSYTVQKKSTRFYFYVNNTGSAAKIHLYTSAEGSAAAATKNDIDVAAGTSLVTYNLATTTNTEVFIGVSSTNIRFCQIIAVETGDSHLLAPAVGYAMSMDKGRLSTASGTATTIDGLTFVVSSGYKPAYSTTAQIGTKGTHYVSFTIPTGQTRQLQLTTSNTAKYTVSKTLGDDENQITPTANTAANYNLEAGTWYINPQGSNVNITNIAFAAAPAQKSVTFKDGSTTLDTKYVWSGDAVTAMSPAPTKSGYRFVKWQLGGVDYDFATAVTDDIVLDAVWQQTWTVTFNSDGGSDVAAATVDNGAAVAKPADPTKVGFDFVEWQLNSAAYNFASAVTSNITLVATWVVAQTDASLSALSYNSNAIDVNSAVETEGVQTYTVHLQWGSTVDDDLISVTKSAETATVSEISYDSENLKATFSVESGNHTVTINYAIQFVIDAKRGTSIVKAVVSGGDQKAGFAATGIYGDKGYAYTRNNKKLDTADKFVGVKLISGKTFATGDKLFVVTSTDADMGYIEIYEEAEGTNLIKATGVRDASEGIEVPELAGYSEFYIVRKASTGDQAWNGFVDYVEVTREINPIIKSFKFGDDAATIDEEHKTISIDVPYGTDVTALTPTIVAYGNNGATYTPTGAQDFTSPVDYTVTDGYSEYNTTYAVTVNVADPSENAYLASLSVAGYALDFNKEVEEYDIVLDYGTTVLPTITYAVEDAGLAEAEKVEGGVSGATTITVTPQAGAGYEKVYTINFSVSTMPKYVIYDGSTMTDYSESGSDLGTGFAWTVVGGSHSEKSAGVTLNGKIYAKGQNIFGSSTASNTRYIEITIPEGYMAKFYLAGATNSKDDMRSSFISKEKTGTLDESIAYVSSDQYSGAYMESDYQFPGTYYYCSNASIRLYELSVTLYSIDYTRTTTPGRLGTICLPYGGTMVGAAVYEVAYFNPDNRKIYFDEVLSGEMEPGMPYIFLPDQGNNDQLVVTYGNNAPAAEAGNHNGLYGSFTEELLEANTVNYILQSNKYWYVNSDEVYVGENRAYLKVEEIIGYAGEPEPTPAPGRRRVSMSLSGQNTATGIDQITNDQSPITNKVIIDGRLFILRGEKMFDATGRMVK